MAEIYCDESGFTGNNLSDSKDTWFSYASVAVNHHDAEAFVKHIIKKYKIQSNELKFGKLKKTNKGQKVISEVLNKFNEQAKVIIYHKKYNVACKLFEYIFEPVLAANNSIFYGLKFNQYVANLLYCFLQCNSKSTEYLFNSFEEMMRTKDFAKLESFFYILLEHQETEETLQDIQEILDLIKQFCISHKNIISKELSSLEDTKTGKWVLELTSTSLASLLSDWGQQFYKLEVFCDQSKPLQEQPEFFNAMIGNTTQVSINTGEQVHPLSFNLKQPIQFVDSKQYPGIQIADIFAGATKFIFQENSAMATEVLSEEILKNWTTNIRKCCIGDSVIPDYEQLNMDKVLPQLNNLLFYELIRRTNKSQPILEDIETFIQNNYINLLMTNNIRYPL